MKLAFSLLTLMVMAPLLLTAQESAPAQRTVTLNLLGLSRGYMQPMSSTTARVAAIKGFSSVEPLGFGGDVLRYRVVTALDDDAIAAALQLEKLGSRGGVVTLAPDMGPRARRAEARAVILEISRAIMDRPGSSRFGTKTALFEKGSNFGQQMKLLGLDPAMADGVFYRQADYYIRESTNSYSQSFQIGAGGDWSPVGRASKWDTFPEATEESARDKANDRFVGLEVSRSWEQSVRWVDAGAVNLDVQENNRSETDSTGKLKVQVGAEFMQQVLRRAVAVRLRSATPRLNDLPSGSGWSLTHKMDADDLHRWGNDGYSINDLSLSWTRRESDSHFIATLTAYHAGHAFYLKAEVDADVVYQVYAARDLNMKEIKDVELGDALTWIVGPEAGPEVFAERRAEAGAGIDALLKSLATLPQGKTLADFAGPMTDEKAAELGVKLEGGHFKAEDYSVARQAMGDVEITIGTAMTGGRWWVLANAATGKVTRSQR